eukprot:PLAT4752.1.p2 GENE.PLAT4752.1~~PLAT4752.1.p2  ORF type:complete len:388 (+),score=184.41 PLAT4752.1:30-1166(+)
MATRLLPAVALCVALLLCAGYVSAADGDDDSKGATAFPSIAPRDDVAGEECDLVSSGAVCLFDGQKVLLPDAAPKGMVGHWSFDELKVLDSSGQGNHGKNPIPPGAGVGGRGASAAFNGFDWVEVPHSASFTSRVFSASFWIYLARDPTVSLGKGLRWCPLLHKGAASDEMAPALMLDRRDGQLKFVVSTDSGEYPEGEYALSTARLPVQRWTHVALVRLPHKLRLYVNGILDAVNTTFSDPCTNRGSLFLGGVPWHRDDCNIASFIDEAKFYSRPLTRDEIQAEASPALGGVEPSFVRYGCGECTLAEAAKICPASYHLCTAMELHTGAYQVARLMGYAKWHTHMWTHGQAEKSEATAADGTFKGDKAKGVGLCCAD